ncbi:MAG: UbiX family flavin prenyltransferase [Candidatus Omnitrophica bacterium]|nr:UbiX family flavin prenyltransferase [Candidatus Omnitrophota bacterium]
MTPVVVGITGASGIVYGIRLVQTLLESGRKIHLVLSESARLVVHEELKISLKSLVRHDALEELFGPFPKEQLTAFSPKDFTAPIASGSYPVSGMVIVPCSMGTLGAVASGLSQNLIHRAADCMIKEGRRLVLVPRETPLSAVHLENMLKLARLGVRIVPAMPAFYSGAGTVAEMVDFLVGKTLDQLEIQHALYPRWTGSLERMSR